MSRQADFPSSTSSMAAGGAGGRRALMEPDKALQGLGQATPAEPRLNEQERQVLAHVTQKIRRWRNIGLLVGGTLAGIAVARRKYSPVARIFAIGAGMGVGGVVVAPLAAISSRDEIRGLMKQEHFRETLKEAAKRGEDPVALLSKSAHRAGEDFGATEDGSVYAPPSPQSSSRWSGPDVYDTPAGISASASKSSRFDGAEPALGPARSGVPAAFDSSNSRSIPQSQSSSGFSGASDSESDLSSTSTDSAQQQSRWSELRNEKTSPESSWERIRQENGRRNIPRGIRGSSVDATSSSAPPADSSPAYSRAGTGEMASASWRGSRQGEFSDLNDGSSAQRPASGQDEGARQREMYRREFESGMDRERNGVQGSEMRYG